MPILSTPEASKFGNLRHPALLSTFADLFSVALNERSRFCQQSFMSVYCAFCWWLDYQFFFGQTIFCRLTKSREPWAMRYGCVAYQPWKGT
jgi:hypothetical protein